MTPTTDVKPDMIPSFQTGNEIPHDRYNIFGIGHGHTNRIDNIFTQRQLYIDKVYMALDTFCIMVFPTVFCKSVSSFIIYDHVYDTKEASANDKIIKNTLHQTVFGLSFCSTWSQLQVLLQGLDQSRTLKYLLTTTTTANF